MNNEAYSQAMTLDPLLPEELHPSAYRGKEVVEKHRTLLLNVEKRLT
jgi:DNA-binding transcriptional regulator PaaX